MRDSGQKEYARNGNDVHANFKRVGNYLNLPAEKALMVYLLKHIDGIAAYIDGHKSQRETVSGRIIDAIVYLFLLYELIGEENQNDDSQEQIDCYYYETTKTN
jgi:hypothetical protein